MWRSAIVAGLICSILCSFQIYSPESAKTILPSEIHYTIANFGHIPYGSTLIAKLKLSEPRDLCLPNETFAEQQKDQQYFLIGERGDCKFTTKAANAQKSGAKLAIIEDKKSSSDGVIMANDGYGFLVDIPSIFISYEDGEKLKQVMSATKQDVVALIRFETQKRDNATLSIWIDPNERHSFVLIRDLEEYYLKIKEKVNVEVFYKVLDRCLFCDTQNCLTKGEWCILPHEASAMTGRDIITQSVRQSIIAEESIEKWWRYIDRFDKDCSITKGFAECSEEIMKDLKMDSVKINAKTNEQIKLAVGGNWSILRGWLELASKGNIIFYPDVSINNINYQGELTAPNIFQMLCNSIYDEPAACKKETALAPGPLVVPEGSLVPTILLILVLMVVGFFVLLVIYRRVIRKEMQQEMTTQVNQMVSQYISFYDSKDGTAEKH